MRREKALYVMQIAGGVSKIIKYGGKSCMLHKEGLKGGGNKEQLDGISKYRFIDSLISENLTWKMK